MENTFNKRYKYILIDSVNLFYKVCSTKDENIALISQKEVYKNSICNFIKEVEYLVSRYLEFGGIVYLLFDNYFSRADLQTAFTFSTRKSLDESYKKTRKKENRPFYQSLNFIRYYYVSGSDSYKVVRIDGLEADDLVQPFVDNVLKNDTCLLVTNDLDWSKYMSSKVDWLPKLGENPQTIKELSDILGFDVDCCNIVIYKALFGDPSDNIQSIISKNDESFKEFKKIILNINRPEDLVYESRSMSKDIDCVHKAVKENECQYLINCQLVSSIACDYSVFEKNTECGHNNITLIKTLRESIGLDQSSKKYEFGSIKKIRK